MRTTTILLVIAAISCGCSLTDNDLIRNPRNLSRKKDSEKKGLDSLATGMADTTIYLTTVEFAEGYDWQHDEAGETADFKVCAYKNGIKIISIQGGHNNNVASSADMHRLIGGNLYTDYSTSTETIISRNGTELFRYNGREMIIGFLVREDGIYTLGQNRSGQGLSYRRNGEVLYTHNEGSVIGRLPDPSCESGALSMDGEDIVFFFCVRFSSASGDRYVCYSVRNGKAETIETDPEINAVFDMRIIEGETYIAAGRNGQLGAPILYRKGKTVEFNANHSENIGNCRLLWHEDKICLSADLTFSAWKDVSSILWDIDKRTILRTRDGERIITFHVDERGHAFVYVDKRDVILGAVYMGDAHHCAYNPKGEYCVMSLGCSVLKGHTFYTGMSSRESGKPPIVTRNDKADTLHINGYISSIKVGISRKE